VLELRQLQYFVTLSETKNFARAAEREYITQSAMSQQIARLESDLGVRLFTRTPRGTDLTPAGRELVPLARSIIDGSAAVQKEAADLARHARP
jgi:DNA-binding transcriptional LysR family regulator